MEKIRPGLTLLFLFAGCPTGSPIPGQPPIETAADVLVTPAASPTPRAPAASTVPETQASQAPSATPEAAQPADTPVLTQSSGPLTVQIFSDSDVEVSALKYLVSGRALPERFFLSMTKLPLSIKARRLPSGSPWMSTKTSLKLLPAMMQGTKSASCSRLPAVPNRNHIVFRSKGVPNEKKVPVHRCNGGDRPDVLHRAGHGGTCIRQAGPEQPCRKKAGG